MLSACVRLESMANRGNRIYDPMVLVQVKTTKKDLSHFAKEAIPFHYNLAKQKGPESNGTRWGSRVVTMYINTRLVQRE